MRKRNVFVFHDDTQMCRRVADDIINLVSQKPQAVIGVVAGRAPEGVYAELARRFRFENDMAKLEKRPMSFTFEHATFFATNEFVNLPYNHRECYHRYLDDKLFRHINANPANIHIPDGMRADKEEACRDFEKAIKKAGGIDFQILDMEQHGFIGFNEPDSGVGTRTRVVRLSDEALQSQASCFNKHVDDLPDYAITIGVGTIFKRVRRVGLLAVGPEKVAMVQEMLKGKSGAPRLPAMLLQRFPNMSIYIKPEASA